jgi:hypothetical protein
MNYYYDRVILLTKEGTTRSATAKRDINDYPFAMSRSTPERGTIFHRDATVASESHLVGSMLLDVTRAVR